MDPITLITAGAGVVRGLKAILPFFGDKAKKVSEAIDVLDDAAGEISKKPLPPEARLELEKAWADRDVRLEEVDLGKLEIIGETMQVESQSEHWPQYSWRPFWGFASGSAFFAICIFFCFLAWRAITKMDAAAMAMIPQLVTSFVPLFAIAGSVLGIATWGRNRLKEKQAGGK